MATPDISITQQAQNMEQFHRLMEVGFGGGDTSVVDELFAPNFVEHQAGVHPANVEGVKGLIASLHQALPDLRCTIEDTVADGDTVWARMRGEGTHHGAFMGRPPTGNAVAITIIDICRFEGGKVVEHWGVPDRLSMLEQMGIIPRPQQASH